MSRVQFLEALAKTGDIVALGRLGAAYRYGLWDTEKNEEKAQYWYKKRFKAMKEKAEREGDLQAMRIIALAYHLGDGVEKDQVKSSEWEARAKKKEQEDD